MRNLLDILEVHQISMVPDSHISAVLDNHRDDGWEEVGRIDRLSVFSPASRLTYFVRTHEGDGVAFLMLSDMMVAGSPAFMVESMGVQPRWRGQGIALKLYLMLICRLGLTLVSGRDQTSGGRAIWESLAEDDRIDIYATYEDGDMIYAISSLQVAYGDDGLLLVAKASGF